MKLIGFLILLVVLAIFSFSIHDIVFSDGKLYPLWTPFALIILFAITFGIIAIINRLLKRLDAKEEES